jgi:hypothetical protein
MVTRDVRHLRYHGDRPGNRYFGRFYNETL